MNEPIATLGDTCDQAHRFTQVLFVPHDWRRDWLVLKVGVECFEKEFVYEYDEVRDLRDRLDRWLGDVDALRALREYGGGLLRGDIQSDVQDPRDVQAMLHMLPSVLYPLPRMAESRQGAGGLPMRVYRVIHRSQWCEIASGYFNTRENAEKELERMREYYPNTRIVEEIVAEEAWNRRARI